MTKNPKITIIGAGTGGYVAALRAAQLGAEVKLIEKDKIGGICLNFGCIPTKSLVHISNNYSQIKSANRYGIEYKELKLNMKKVIKNKNNVVKQLVGGVEFLLKKHDVKVIKGTAQIIDKNLVSVETQEGNKTVDTDYIIIATGSKIKKAPIKGIEQ
ncbi:MAG: FAD-dependent oxidoreductase, partial [Halanaerobiales bacterium]|nr:FAD-dependent oxidoreductase [Halanaerobiales bacterium]